MDYNRKRKRCERETVTSIRKQTKIRNERNSLLEIKKKERERETLKEDVQRKKR